MNTNEFRKELLDLLRRHQDKSDGLIESVNIQTYSHKDQDTSKWKLVNISVDLSIGA